MTFYRVFSILLFPFLELYLFFRVLKKKEDKERLCERFGKPTKNRPAGDLIWLHAVSVGETNSALVLVEELLKKFPQTSILFTTTTLTSAATIAQKISQFNDRVIHQFLPIDSFFCVKDFLNFWEPSKVVFVESEIWPNLISESKSMGAKVFLVNARMSEKSFNRWHFANKFDFKIFDCFDLIFAQSEQDRQNFTNLTGSEVLFYGNLKSQATNLTFNQAELEKLKSQIGSRKFWLAASTHKGEEELVVKAHRELKKYFPNLLTIIAPRHPSRSEEIKKLFAGINFASRSAKEEIKDDVEIYLADSLGELGTFYRLSSFAFLGGSLFEIGGHNPFEPIKLECVVISGRGVFNNKEIYTRLEQYQACIMVNSGAELTRRVAEFLHDDDLVKAISKRALDLIASSEDIAKKIVDKIEKI